MTVEDVIKYLQQFDKSHTVEMEIDTECGHVTVGSQIQEIHFKNGKCVLYGSDY